MQNDGVFVWRQIVVDQLSEVRELLLELLLHRYSHVGCEAQCDEIDEAAQGDQTERRAALAAIRLCALLLC